MGEDIKREFGILPVETGRYTPSTGPIVDPSGLNVITQGQPGAPIVRPSFLSAFLSSLGPALAGGLAAQPGQPFGSGLGGALAGIQQFNQRQFENQQIVQQQQRANQEAIVRQQLQQQQLQQNAAIFPLQLQQQQMQNDLMRGQIAFFGNPENLDNAVGEATQSLGKLEPAEQAQIDAAKKEATVSRKFDPINAAVKTISQDRLQTERGNLDPGKRELNDYLNNPTIDRGKKKDAATFVAWKARTSPAAVVLQNMLPQGNALDQQAELYAQTHELPSGLTRSPGTTAAIIARAAQLHPEMNLAANQATFEGDKKSLSNLQKNFDQVSAFENTAIKNLDQVAQAGAKVPDLSSRFANVAVRSINARMLGTKEMAQFRTALLTAQNEAAKVLTSANATGTLSDSARHEAQDVLDGNLPFPAMLASINQLKTDFANRHTAYQQQIDLIKGRMGGAKNTPPSGRRVISLVEPNAQ